MLAASEPIVVLTLIVYSAFLVVLPALGIVGRRLRKRYPSPPELKRASREERRKLGRFIDGKEVDIDPDLARAYVRYSISSAATRRRSERLVLAFLVLGLLLAILVNPVAEPMMWLVIAVVLICIVLEYRTYQRFNRFVARWSEASS
jgi:Flp pilus assembly protein TadB